MGSWGAEGAFSEAWTNAQHAFGALLTTVQEHWLVAALVVVAAAMLWRWSTASTR